jgi:hypothetical protein
MYGNAQTDDGNQTGCNHTDTSSSDVILAINRPSSRTNLTVNTANLFAPTSRTSLPTAVSIRTGIPDNAVNLFAATICTCLPANAVSLFAATSLPANTRTIDVNQTGIDTSANIAASSRPSLPVNAVYLFVVITRPSSRTVNLFAIIRPSFPV